MKTVTKIIIAKLLFLLFLTAGCATNPATGRSQLSLLSMSTSEEVALGEKLFPQIVQKMGGEYPDEVLQAYVQSVGERLRRAGHRSDISFTFRVVNDSTPNAFALPGGYVAITRGLLVNLENEAQLAAVLGHEIGHVDARHAVQGLQRKKLLGLGLAVLGGVTVGADYGSLVRTTGEVAATLLDRSYSRGQEKESDRLGIDYMVESGYDPEGAVELQQIFVERIEQNNDPQWLEGLFRTHPFSKKRLEGNREYIATVYGTHRGGQPPADSFTEVTAGLRELRTAYGRYDQARRFEKEGTSKEAITLYLEAAALAPDEGLILTGLGLAYLRQEEVVTARQHLQRAVRLDGNYYLSRLGLAYCYLSQGEYRQTVRHAEKSFALLPTVESLYLSARGYDGQGDVSKALERYLAVEQSGVGGSMAKAAAARRIELEGQ